MDRNSAARCIAKVFAYLAVGNRTEARVWAKPLIEWLQDI
jgi:hypothetical protein